MQKVLRTTYRYIGYQSPEDKLYCESMEVQLDAAK